MAYGQFIMKIYSQGGFTERLDQLVIGLLLELPTWIGKLLTDNRVDRVVIELDIKRSSALEQILTNGTHEHEPINVPVAISIKILCGQDF